MGDQFGPIETDMRKLNSEAVALDPIHCRAICEEIGERLRHILKLEAEIPQRLLTLLERLDELEGAPSIVPTIEDISSLRYRPLDLTTQSNDPRHLFSATSRKLASAGS